MDKYPEIKLLSDFLRKEEVPESTPIHFREVSDTDNRYALQIECDDNPELAKKLAAFWGCPEDELPGEGEENFEASDDWHGIGKGDLREFADELGKWSEQFFDTTLSVGEIHSIEA